MRVLKALLAIILIPPFILWGLLLIPLFIIEFIRDGLDEFLFFEKDSEDIYD